MNIEERILGYLKAVYPLSLEHQQEILTSFESIGEEDKKMILIAVHKRYEDFLNNTNTLKRNVDIAGNNIEEIKEKQKVDDLFKNII